MEEEIEKLLIKWSTNEDVQCNTSCDTISKLTLELLELIPSILMQEILHCCKKHIDHNTGVRQLFEAMLPHYENKQAFYDFVMAVKKVDIGLYDKLYKLDENGIVDKITKEFRQTKENFYKVSSNPRGQVLIINQTFDWHPTNKRIGSEKNVQSLKFVFDNLDYTVKDKPDLKCDDMLTEIENFVSDKCHKSLDTAGIIIMSHGMNDRIECSDEKLVSLQDIINRIKCKNSQLIDKPVFIIINACRGNQEMKMNSEVQQCFPGQTDVNLQEDIDKNNGFGLPKDCFLLHSTLPDHLSSRPKQLGSIFIHELCKVLQEYGSSLSWEEIIKLVSETKIDAGHQMKGDGGLKPMAESTLTKTFYLDTHRYE